jgi:hypothetical protein
MMMPAPNGEGADVLLEQLAQFVPALRARHGELPRPVDYTVVVEIGTGTVIVTAVDEANDARHTRCVSLDDNPPPPPILMTALRGAIFAPFN